MRTWVLVICLLAVGTASADPVKTTEAVVLRKKPGEKEEAVGKLKAGTTVVVESEAGRWLKVRAGSLSGYVIRTQLTGLATAPGGSSGQWSANAKKDPALGTVLDQQADTRAVAPATTVTKTAELVPARGPFHADLGIGYRTLGRDFSSNGTAGLANYTVSAAAAGLVLDGGYDQTMGKLKVGGDVRIDYGRSTIDYTGPSAPSDKIGFSTLATDLGARAGSRVKMFDLALRLGFHYEAFLAGNVDNTAGVARESLFGATIGARADILPPNSRFNAAARVDVLAVGARHQTPGLEDGTSSKAHAVWAGVTFRVALKEHIALMFAYDFSRASTYWSGMSVREPGVTSASRIDNGQLFQLGVGGDL